MWNPFKRELQKRIPGEVYWDEEEMKAEAQEEFESRKMKATKDMNLYTPAEIEDYLSKEPGYLFGFAKVREKARHDKAVHEEIDARIKAEVDAEYIPKLEALQNTPPPGKKTDYKKLEENMTIGFAIIAGLLIYSPIIGWVYYLLAGSFGDHSYWELVWGGILGTFWFVVISTICVIIKPVIYWIAYIFGR